MDYIFDTHAHYDDEAFDADREEVLTGLKEQGIGTVVNVGASIASTKTTLALAEAASLHVCGGGRASERDGGAYGCGHEMAGISGRKPEGCGDR